MRITAEKRLSDKGNEWRGHNTTVARRANTELGRSIGLEQLQRTKAVTTRGAKSQLAP
jgi:hypothetical protein